MIIRSYIEVPQSSEGLFKLLTSAEGAKILDDTTNHTDAPLEVLKWQDRQALLLPRLPPVTFQIMSATRLR